MGKEIREDAAQTIPEIPGPQLIEAPETPQMLRQKFRELIHNVLNVEPQQAEAQKFYENLLSLRDKTLKAVEDVERGDESVLKEVKTDIAELLDEVYLDYIAERKDLPEDFKSLLVEESGPMQFRSQVFNQLCESRIFGLQPEQKYTGKANETEFRKYIEQKLSNEELMLFENICSKYDGLGALNAAKEVMQKSAGLIEGEKQGVKERAEERFNLTEKIRDRIEKDVRALIPQIEKANKFSRGLREGLDFGLKGAALIAFLNGAFVPALWFYAGKGAIEAFTGVDFADLIQVGMKRGFCGAGRFSGWILEKCRKKLPENIQAKLPVSIERALIKPKAPSVVTTGSLWARFFNIPAGVRLRHFTRSLLPFGGNIFPYEKLPKVGQYLPERQKALTDIQHEKFEAKKAEIEKACQIVIQKYKTAEVLQEAA